MNPPESVRSLMQQPLIARISVIDDRGYPHTLPIWFIRDGDDVMFFSSRTARKISFAKANAKGAVSIGGNPYGSEGYMLKGEFAIEEDPSSHWLREITFRYESPKLAEQHVRDWSGPDIVVMRFKTAQSHQDLISAFDGNFGRMPSCPKALPPPEPIPISPSSSIGATAMRLCDCRPIVPYL